MLQIPARWARLSVLSAFVAAALLLGGLAGSAQAAGTAPAPAQAAGKLKLRFSRVFRVKGHLVTVPGRSNTVHGWVTPFVPGQKVVVRIAMNGRVFKTQHLRLKRAANGRSGWFTTRYGAAKVGRLTVSVRHAATRAQRAFAVRRSYASLNEHVGPGSTGRFVQLVQQRLAHLHFYLLQSGVYDLQTELAVDAYHRLLGRGHATTLDPATTSDLLNGRGSFHVRFPHQGRHAEGDLTHQILALVDGSKVKLLFPISSGKPSTPTILGSFRIYYRVPGYLPDGMYYSNFFIRGYAIHGYNPAPDYPASHGCMRLPISDAITVFHWLAMGDWVDTYYR